MADGLLGSSEGLDPAKEVEGLGLLTDPNAPGPFKAGLGAGVAGVKSNLYGAAALAAHGVGAIAPAPIAAVAADAEAAALERAAIQSEIAAEGTRQIEDVDWKSPSSIAQHFKYLLGNAVPSLALMFAGGVAGRALGIGARRLGAAAAAPRVGTFAGAVAPDVALEAGGIYPEALKTGVENPALRAAAGGGAAASLDFIPLLAAEKYLAAAGRGGYGAMARGALKGAPVGAVLEGSQELGQALIERAAAGLDLASPDAVSDYINSFAGGAAPGVLFGAGIGANRGRAAPAVPEPLPPPAPAAQPAAPAPMAPIAPAAPLSAEDAESIAHANLVTAHDAAAGQATAIEAQVAKSQADQAATSTRLAELKAELDKPVGERRTRSEILSERKALTSQMTSLKAGIEALGGQLHAARTTMAEIAPKITAAEAAMKSREILARTPAELNPEIKPKAPAIESDVIADPNRPVTSQERIDRAVRGVHQIFRDQGMPLTTTRESLDTPVQSRREAALARVAEQTAPKETIRAPSAAQMAAVEPHAMVVIEPMAKQIAEAKTKTPEGQAKVRANLISAMRDVVQAAAKKGSVAEAQAYITEAMPAALKGHGVTADAADIAKAVSAAVGQATTQYSRGASNDKRFANARGEYKHYPTREWWEREVQALGLKIVPPKSGNKGLFKAVDSQDREVGGWDTVFGDGWMRLYKPDSVESNAALTQPEFDALPPADQPRVIDEYNRIMTAKGTALIAHLRQLIGHDPHLVVTTFQATPGSPIGSYTRVDKLKSLISLATNAKQDLSVADHEGFHYVEDQLLDARERAVIRTALAPGKPMFEQLMAKVQQYDRENRTNLADEVAATPAEAHAYAFEFWRRGDLKIEGLINQVFEKIAAFLRAVHRYVTGEGFTTIEDIFTALDRGQFAERQRPLSEGPTNLRTALVGPDGGVMVSRAADQTQTVAFKKWFGDSKVVNSDGAPMAVYHGAPEGRDFTEFDRKASGRTGIDSIGSWFTTSEQAQLYSGDSGQIMPVYLALQNPLIIDRSRAEAQAAIDDHNKLEALRERISKTDGLTAEEIQRRNELYALVRERGTRSLTPAQRKEYDSFGKVGKTRWAEVNEKLKHTRDGDTLRKLFNMEKAAGGTKALRDSLTRQDYDGIILRNTIGDSSFQRPPADMWVAFYPEQIKSAIGNVGTFDPKNPDIRFSQDDTARWYRSALTDQVAGLAMKSGTAQSWQEQIKGLVAAGKVKQTEIDAVGLNELLEMQRGNEAAAQDRAERRPYRVVNSTTGPNIVDKNGLEVDAFPAGAFGETDARDRAQQLNTESLSRKISKEEIVSFLREHGVRVEEVVLGAKIAPTPELSTHLSDAMADYLAAYDLEWPTNPVGWIDIQQRLESSARGERARVQLGRGGTELEALRLEELAMEATRHSEGMNENGERIFSDTKYADADYQLPGGQQYREVLLTLPGDDAGPPRTMIEILDAAGMTLVATNGGWDVIRTNGDTVAQGATQARAMENAGLEVPAGVPITGENRALFTAPHFGEHGKNLLAHVRLNSRVDASGAKVLFLEEIQSDWAQAGKKQGFKGGKALTAIEGARLRELEIKQNTLGRSALSATEFNEWATLLDRNTGTKNGIAPAPFVTKTDAWVALVLKRMIRYAIETGHDKIAWTTGEQQVQRYENALRKHVDAIEWTKTPSGVQLVGWKGAIDDEVMTMRRETVYALDQQINQLLGDRSLDELSQPERLTLRDLQAQRRRATETLVRRQKVVDTQYGENELSDAIGKAMADRIRQDPAQSGSIEGENIKIDDTGMAGFYERIVPKVANEILKKFGGGKVGEVGMPGKEFVPVRVARGRWAVENENNHVSTQTWATAAEAAAWAAEAESYDALLQPGFSITPQLVQHALNGLPLFSRAAVAPHAMVNIGLAVNDGSKVSPEEALSALAEIGVRVQESVVRQSGTEPTLIARLDRALTPAEAHALAAKLRQEAVAQVAHGAGELYGPGAAKWQPFNAEFFLGLKEGDALPLNAQLPAYGRSKPGSVSVPAVHFSPTAGIARLTSDRYGTGILGAERPRVVAATDARLKQRLHFYVPQGYGVAPEKGVGANAYGVTLSNLYDASADPLRIWTEQYTVREIGSQGSYVVFSTTDKIAAQAKLRFLLGQDPEGRYSVETKSPESAVLDAGYDGYLSRESSTAVLLGAHSVPVVSLGSGEAAANAALGSLSVPPMDLDANRLLAEDLIRDKRLPGGQLRPAEWKDAMAKAAPDLLARLPKDVFEGTAPVYRDQLIRAFYRQAPVDFTGDGLGAVLQNLDTSQQVRYSRAAVIAKAAMEREMTAGELQQAQLFQTTAGMMEDAMKHGADNMGKLALGALSTEVSGGLSRWWQKNIATPNFTARISNGYKNVFRVLNTYVRYRNELVERMLIQKLPLWYTASAADQDATFNALNERNVAGYTRASAELRDLTAKLTEKQRAMFLSATQMFEGFLKMELEADKGFYQRVYVTPGEYEKWLARRTDEVSNLIDKGYMPLRRYGDHTVHVYMESMTDDGKPVKLSGALEFFGTARGAHAAAKIYEAEIARTGATLKVEVGTHYKAARDTTISAQQFLDTARRNGVPLNAFEQERLVKALSAADSLTRNRLLHREGMPGYSKDGMRVLNEFGMRMSGKLAYSRFASAIDAASDGRAVESDIVKGEAQIAVDEERNLWKEEGPMSGFHHNLADELTDYVLVPDHTGGWSRKLRGAAMAYFIGGSLSGALVNTMSVPMLVVPELSIHTNYMNAMTTTMSAWKTTWQYQHILRDIERLKSNAAEDAIPGVSKDLRAALVEAAQYTMDTELHQIMGISQGALFSQNQAVQRAMKAWMAPFRISEQTNRIASFIAAYNVATTGEGVKQADGTSKRLSGQALFHFARDMIDATQNNYNETNRPGAARNPVYALMFMFKSFPLFMTEAIVLMYKANPKSAIYMLLGLTAMTGVQGLPFAEAIEDLIDTIAQQIFGSPFNTRRAMRNTIKAASDAIVGYDMSDLVLRGVINSVLGVSASSRIGAGDFVPGSRLGTADADQGRVLQQMLGAPYAMLKDAASNIGGLATLDWKEAADALRNGGPIAVRNAIKGVEQFSNGYASDSKGRKLIDVTGLDAMLQMAGVSSAGLAKGYEFEKINHQVKAFYTQVSADMQNQLVRAMKDGDTAKVQEVLDMRTAWNKQYPEMPLMANAAAVRRDLALSGLPMDRRSQLLWSRQIRRSNMFSESGGESQ